MQYRQSLLLAAIFVAATTDLMAAPSLSVSAEGNCPSQRDLELALRHRGLELGGANYSVFVQSEATGAVMRLQRFSDQHVLERRFVSQDCRAIADAIAVVVEAYFIDVGLPPGEAGGLTPAASPGENAVGDGAQSVSAPKSNRRADVPGPNASAIAPSFPVQTALPEPRLLAVVAPASRTEQSARAFSVSQSPLLASGFVGIGPRLNLPQASLVPSLELGGGVDLRNQPISAEVALATTWPSISGIEPDRVRRWASQGILRIGAPLVSTLRYRPWAGVGLSLSRLRALDVAAAPTKTSATAVLGAGLEMAWPMGKGWFGRLDVSCMILATRDTYQVDPDGEIGRGPRVVCASMVGVGLAGLLVGR
jgi:hypothetical protein